MKLFKKQRDAGQSVISMEQIKYEWVCVLMKMVQSRKVKYSKSTYKENITFAITPYQLVGNIQGIKESLWDHKKTCKNYSLSGICDRMYFLMAKWGILRGESLFWC